MSKYKLKSHLLEILGDSLDPAGYIERIWNKPYTWQEMALNPLWKRIMLNCARQSGKSTIVAGVACHTAKYTARSLSIIVSPSEKQSQETMKKVEDYIAGDPELNKTLVKDSAFEKEFANGSRIIALPGTERSVRGYSGPAAIIIDEAARVPDETYKAIRPMLTGNPLAKLILLSTPWNKQGFFFDEWTKNPIWKKILVKPKWDLDEDTMQLVEALNETEFKALWAEKGVDAFYSPRHEVEWLYEELLSAGPIWFKREYGCQFIQGMESMFDLELVESAYTDKTETHYSDEDRYDQHVEVADFLGGLFDG
ncbi:terminase family protein [Candidatus Pacearchaeota archaeon]|nr:terminase family protein [Candidatus Pacearchaeota archaeon]